MAWPPNWKSVVAISAEIYGQRSPFSIFPTLLKRYISIIFRLGADCVISASYQVSFEGFAEAGLSANDTVRALETSVAIAERARARFSNTHAQGAQPLIAASVGPYGAIFHNGAEYHGKL